MSETPRPPLPSYSTLTTEEKVDEILRIVRGLADTAVEHDAKLTLIAARLGVNEEDTVSLTARMRHVENGLTDLTAIALRHERRLIDQDKSIHELQRDEEQQRGASLVRER